MRALRWRDETQVKNIFHLYTGNEEEWTVPIHEERRAEIMLTLSRRQRPGTSPLSDRTLWRMLERCSFLSRTPALRYSLSNRSRKSRSSHSSSSIAAADTHGHRCQTRGTQAVIKAHEGMDPSALQLTRNANQNLQGEDKAAGTGHQGSSCAPPGLKGSTLSKTLTIWRSVLVTPPADSI